MLRIVLRPALVLGLVLAGAGVASGQQTFESIGNRALGMAGAFVAVADDATAVYWNPAGLAAAGRVGATIGWTRLRTGNPDRTPGPGAAGQNSTFMSLGSWPLGLTYGRVRETALTSGSGGAAGLETIETTTFGVTLLQTLTRGVVLGSNLKYLRGGLTTGQSTALTAGRAVNDGLDLEGPKDGAFDIDLGLMIDMRRVRLGATTRNLRQPRFADGLGTSVTLRRLTRAGVAVLATDGLTLAMDVDLDTVDLRGGLRRMIAFGAERDLGDRLAVRGGVRWNLEAPRGHRQPVAAAGASVRIRSGLWLEGFYTQGRIDGDRGFGFGLRAGS